MSENNKSPKQKGETKKEKEERAKDMRVLKYLENQLRIKREQMQALEEPFDKELLKDGLQVQLLIKRTQIDQLQDQIDAIKLMLEKQ